MAARKKAHIKAYGKPERRSRQYWEAHIVESIKEFFYGEFGLETVADIQKTPHNVFNAALEYARSQCVHRGELLEYVTHNASGATIHNEQYSAQAVGELCEAYVSICSLFDRVPCVYSFAVLSGIDRTTLEGWINDVKGVTTASRLDKQKSLKNLRAARAVSLSNLALSGGKSSIGAIAHLNNEVWRDMPVTEDTSRPLPACELPVLDASGAFIERAALPDLGAELPTFESSASGLPVLG